MAVIFLLFSHVSAFAGDFAGGVAIDPKLDFQDLTSQVETYERPLGTEGQSDFVHFPFAQSNTLSASEIHRGYTDSQLWLRLELANLTDQAVERILFFSSPLTGSVELHIGDHTLKSGSSVTMGRRAIPSRLTAFPVTLAPGTHQTIYIEQHSQHSLASRLQIASPERFKQVDSDGAYFVFFYLGGILCLIVYNLFVGFFARDPNFFYYALFSGSYVAATLALSGFLDVFFQPETGFTFSTYLMCFSSFVVLSALAFAFHFLNIRKIIPRAVKGFYLLAAPAALTFIAGLIPESALHHSVLGNVVDVNIVLTTVFAIACSVVCYRRGYALAKFLILSWLPVFVSVIIWFSMTHGLLPAFFITQHILSLGNIGEMLILSLGLAYKMNILDREVKIAHQKVKEQARYHLLVRVLSHDVANAITLLSVYVDRLSEAKLEEPFARVIKKAEGVIVKITETLNFVRAEERLKSFETSTKFELVDLLRAVKDVTQFHEDGFRGKRLEVAIEIPSQTLVKAERSILTNQVLSNLLSNAIKFSRQNGRITISTSVDKNFVSLCVRDQGVGIRKADIARIFFSDTLVSTVGTSNEAGMGLGTTLVREYMRKFQGEVVVDSVHESESPDSGTTIILKFPHPEAGELPRRQSA